MRFGMAKYTDWVDLMRPLAITVLKARLCSTRPGNAPSTVMIRRSRTIPFTHLVGEGSPISAESQTCHRSARIARCLASPFLTAQVMFANVSIVARYSRFRAATSVTATVTATTVISAVTSSVTSAEPEMDSNASSDLQVVMEHGASRAETRDEFHLGPHGRANVSFVHAAADRFSNDESEDEDMMTTQLAGLQSDTAGRLLKDLFAYFANILVTIKTLDIAFSRNLRSGAHSGLYQSAHGIVLRGKSPNADDGTYDRQFLL
ncbi:uncharacterized protein EV422DRAFT_570038 [Fimicolochytrium jonesii]|uniref:uncharacterized protein n=1 Tax=Fimicolochytrium jonesii TaxID=1396493 RepID=UPI0022FF34D8|nr:uncharacterized protein EV422DRAFT_570038 [Fimicolochytrium jonesii]KAI8818263.1 hypothetical protein EV422DRAFT_570038 [Fimicolochytrium jonesii]